MIPDQRHWVAIHEGGHAVANVVLGRTVEYVSIRPGKTFAGLSVAATEDIPDMDRWNQFLPISVAPPAFRADLEKRIIAKLAGEIAATLLYQPSSVGAPPRLDPSETESIARKALDSLGPRLAARRLRRGRGLVPPRRRCLREALADPDLEPPPGQVRHDLPEGSRHGCGRPAAPSRPCHRH